MRLDLTQLNRALRAADLHYKRDAAKQAVKLAEAAEWQTKASDLKKAIHTVQTTPEDALAAGLWISRSHQNIVRYQQTARMLIEQSNALRPATAKSFGRVQALRRLISQAQAERRAQLISRAEREGRSGES